MKNFISLTFVFYFLLQISNLSYGQDSRWVYISSSDKYDFFIDKTTVKCIDQDFLIWEKHVCTSDCTYNYSIQKIRINVNRRQSSIVTVTRYWDNGNILTIEGSGQWADIVPESMGETIFDYLCKWYSCK